MYTSLNWLIYCPIQSLTYILQRAMNRIVESSDEENEIQNEVEVEVTQDPAASLEAMLHSDSMDDSDGNTIPQPRPKMKRPTKKDRLAVHLQAQKALRGLVCNNRRAAV